VQPLETALAKLTLYLLGAPRAESDGAPLITDTRKATALLAYLAVSGMGHTRDAIAALLWPDLDQVRARAALRRTLSSINAAADATWLRADREHIALIDDVRSNSTVWSDVGAFRAALAETRTHGHAANALCPHCLDALERAVALYRDDFMAGFSLRDSISFDDWQFFEAEGLRRDLADTLERLVELHIAQRNWQPAITCARRRLSLDSLHEPAHRQLMLLYAWSGERAAAVRQYQVCADILARELDVPPLPETVDLFQAIKEQREPAPPPAMLAAMLANSPAIVVEPALPASSGVEADSDAPSVQESASNEEPATVLMVGRDREQTQLQALWYSAAAMGKFALLQGEAGIGKTTLAEAFVRSAHAQGAVVLSARCYEGEQDLTLTPFIEMLRNAFAHAAGKRTLANLDAHWTQELRRLLPELPGSDVDSTDAGDAAGAKARLYEAVAHVLFAHFSQQGGNRKAVTAPGILFLDDAQWLDAASLELLSYLVNRLQTYPMLVLATLRSGEGEGEQRVRQILAEAQRRQSGEVMEVARLVEDDVAELVERRLPGVAARTPDLVARLFSEAEGLAFFVVEYLAALERAEIDPNAPWQQPESIRDLLRARLSRIGEVEQQVLTTAAVVGRSFDFSTLRAASGRSEDETLQAIEVLVSRTLLREIEGEVFDFAHEQLRAVVYESASLTRRRLLHRRVADTLVAAERVRGREGLLDAARIAQHYERAGQMQDAARYYFLAGVRAAEMRANPEALEYLRRAGTLGYGDRAELHSRMGDLRTLIGDYAEALRDYAVALELTPAGAPASTPGEVAAGSVARVRLYQRLARVHHRMGDYAAANAEWRMGLRMLEGSEEHDFASWMLAELSLTLRRQGDTHGALTIAQQALNEAEHTGASAALSRAHAMISHLNRLQGNHAEALSHARAALVLAESLDDLGLHVAALNSLALASVSGEQARERATVDAADAHAEGVRTAIPLLERALELCQQQGDRHREAALHNNLADVYHLLGNQPSAMQHLTSAVTIFAEIGSGLGVENPEIWKLTEW
jgi:DNA-binding SARP family transcriptional activator